MGKGINSRGIGLGLHISKKITKIYDGDIICRSQLGKGSNLIFLVAVSLKDESCDQNTILNNRILNPLQKQYQKLDLKMPGTTDNEN